MSETNTSHSVQQNLSQYDDDEINLIELWNTLWAERKLIVLVTGAFAVISVVYSLLLTNIYRAETVLMPVSEGQSTQFGGELGFAATLVGVDLDRATDQAQVAMATLRSREFITNFIHKHDLLPWLFALEFVASRGDSVIDSQFYDWDSKTWIEQGADKDASPSDWDAYRLFSEIISIEKARDTDLVTVGLEWADPDFAAEWLNLLIIDVNNYLREKDRTEASEAIEFLQAQLLLTNLVEMERMLYQLIESQTRILMLADAR